MNKNCVFLNFKDRFVSWFEPSFTKNTYFDGDDKSHQLKSEGNGEKSIAKIDQDDLLNKYKTAEGLVQSKPEFQLGIIWWF